MAVSVLRGTKLGELKHFFTFIYIYLQEILHSSQFTFLQPEPFL